MGKNAASVSRREDGLYSTRFVYSKGERQVERFSAFPEAFENQDFLRR